MDPPFRCECVVSGPLALVLRISQIYGVAFLHIEQVREGSLIRVSRSAAAYWKSVFWILSIAVQIILSWNTCLVNISSSARACAHSVLILMSNIAISSVLLIQTCCGVTRMQHVIICLAQLEKINQELSALGARPSSENKFNNLALWALVFGHLLNAGGFCAYLYSAINKNEYMYLNITKCSIFVASIMLKVLFLQVSLILANGFLSFNHLNCCLISLLRQVKSAPKIWNTNFNGENVVSCVSINKIIDTMTISTDTKYQSLDTTATAVHSLSRQYCRLCKVVQQLNTSHGTVLVSMIAYFFLHFIVTPYNFFTKLFSSTVDYYQSIIEIIWLLYHVMDLIMIVETCHRTNTQMERTKQLVSQLLHVTPGDNQQAIFELELFYKHLTSNNVTYTPNKFFQIDRTLIVTILGSMTTYLVVLIQF